MQVVQPSATAFGKDINQAVPGIRARREEIERERRLPRDLVEAMGAAGVFGLAVPRALGGAEADPLDQLRVIETIAAADGSAGWCAMIALGNGLFAGSMPEQGAQEVFGDTSLPTAAAIAPAGTAERVEGGLRVSGRWRFGSGIDHAAWVLGGCVVLEGGVPHMTSQGPEMTHVFMPASDVRVIDTWHVSGLCGTGSHDFEVSNVFVPDHRIVSVFDRSAHRPEPLYQAPVLALFAPHIAAVALGIGRAALDELTALAADKVPSLSAVTLADKPVTQTELARAEAALSAARALLYEALDDLWQTVVTGREPTMRQHAMCRIAAVHASETSAAVTRTASALAGGTSIYSSSSLQRHARDADALTHHMTQSPQVWEDAGRALLGRSPLSPIF